MKKIDTITISLTLASIIGLAGCRGAASVAEEVPYKVEAFYVSSFDVEKRTIAMDTGAVFEGYFTLKGRDDIRFYIENPNGNKVLDITASSRYDFSYTATSEGPHLITIYFDNSSRVPMQVNLRWRVIRES